MHAQIYPEPHKRSRETRKGGQDVPTLAIYELINHEL